MALRTGLELVTHNFRLSVARQRRGWYNRLTPEVRFNLLLLGIVLLAGLVLFFLMGDLEGKSVKLSIGFVAGIVALVLVSRTPDVLIGVVFILNATIFGFGAWSSMALKFNVFETAEVMLGLLLMFTFWEYLRERPKDRPKLDGVLISTLTFYLIVLAQMLRANFLQEHPWDENWNQYGDMVHYLLLLPMVVYLRKTERLKTFVGILFAFAIISAIQTYYYYYFGTGGWGDLFGLVDVRGRGAGLAVRTPSSMLMVAMTLACFAFYVHSDDVKKKRWYYLGFMAFMLAVAMNKGRNGYIGVMVGSMIIWAFATKAARWKAFTDGFWFALVIAAASVTIPSVGKTVMGIGEQVGIRFSQTFDVREYEAGGYADRVREIQSAWPRFVEHPTFGQGPGEYLRQTYEGTGRGTYKIFFQPYMHNSFVYLLATGGVVTFIAFFTMIIIWFSANVRRVRKLRDPGAKAMGWTAIAYLLAMVLGAWVQPNFFLVAPITTTVVVAGLAEALARKDIEEQTRISVQEPIGT